MPTRTKTPPRAISSAQTPPPPSPSPEPALPPELRRRLPERMDALLAHPLAARCVEACATCDALPEALAEAALARWDMLARAGVWPVKETQICAELRAHGIPVVFTRLKKLVQHRRWRVLTRLVRADIEAWQQSSQRSQKQEKTEG